MSILSAIPIIGSLLEKAFGIVDKLVTDKDQAEKLKAALQAEVLKMDSATLEAQAKLVLGEIKGESWLQRNWRPLLMLMIIGIVANNYVLVPYLGLFTSKVAVLELPGGLWALLNIGVGGYVLGRSGEKIVNTLKNGG